MLLAYVRFQTWLRRQEGQALPEYGLIIGIVAVGAIVLLTAFKDDLKYLFDQIRSAIRGGGGS